MYLNDRILAVDDHRDNLLILEEVLDHDYTLQLATSGEEALRIAPQFRPDLILLDITMPGLDGIDTCIRLRRQPELHRTRIVMLSAKNDVRHRLASYSAGAVDFIAKPFDVDEVAAKVDVWMRMVHQNEVETIWGDTDLAGLAVGEAVTQLASYRDTEDGEHLFRIRWYAQMLAEQLAIEGPYQATVDENFLQNLYRATPLHDIGNVAIGEAILRKPSALTKEEFETMKRHTIVGSELLQHAADNLPSAQYLIMAAEIARSHHERFDGTGYPDGLARTDIPLAARILTVADVLDGLTSKRVYKAEVSLPTAIQFIVNESGCHFDPAIVNAFQSRLDDIHLAYRRFHATTVSESAHSAADDRDAFKSGPVRAITRHAATAETAKHK